MPPSQRLVALVSLAAFALSVSCGGESPSEPGTPTPGTPVQVTTGGGDQPTVSPDGAWVAFLLTGNGIGKVPSTGGPGEPLTTAGREPDWARAGDLILYRDGSDLLTVNPATKATTLVRSGGFDDDAVWSPGGDLIAVQGASPDGLYLISYPSAEIVMVPCITPHGSACSGETPGWAPDGQFIVFADDGAILKVSRNGGSAEEIGGSSAGPGSPAHPTWSPDGNWIAFARESLPEHSHIWVIDARGSSSGPLQITSGAYRDANPAWSPDSRVLYFDSDRSGQREVWKVTFRP